MGFLRFDNYLSAVMGGVRNAFTGLGVRGVDRTASNRIGRGFRGDLDLAELYLGCGLAARIVDAPAADALARGFSIEGDDPDGTIMAECERLGVTTAVTEALRWSRLYGGAALVLFAADTGDMGEPFDPASMAQIDALRVFDVTALRPVADRVYRDPALANWGWPEVYEVRHPVLGETFACHESRMILFSGDPVPPQAAMTREGRLPWRGRGALDGCYDDVLRYIAGLQWCERMLERKQQAVYTMAGLSQMIDQGMDARVQKQIDNVDLVRGVLNTVVIDGGTDGTLFDKYDMRDLSLAGVTDQIAQFQVAISADTAIPVTVLFGRSPAGQNATGESDMEGYYRLVGQIQTNVVRPAIARLVELIVAQRAFTGAKPEEFEIEFEPLWMPSAKEQADTRLANAQADQAEAGAADIYMTAGVMTNAEVRDDLVARDLYGIEGTVEAIDNTPPPPMLFGQPGPGADPKADPANDAPPAQA